MIYIKFEVKVKQHNIIFDLQFNYFNYIFFFFFSYIFIRILLNYHHSSHSFILTNAIIFITKPRMTNNIRKAKPIFLIKSQQPIYKIYKITRI